jgi:amino acid permease
VASLSVVVAQLSVCVASIVFTTDFLDFVFCQHQVASLCHHKSYYLLASFLLSLCIVPIESLACFAYVSLMSIVAILASVTTISLYSASFLRENKPPSQLFEAGGLASFIGISLFSMEGIGMVFPIRSSMKDVSSYPPLYRCVMVSVFFICAVFAFLSYDVGAGHQALGSKVPEVIFYYFGPKYRLLFFLEIMYALGIFVSYPLNLTPIYEIVLKSEKFSRHFNTDSVASSHPAHHQQAQPDGHARHHPRGHLPGLRGQPRSHTLHLALRRALQLDARLPHPRRAAHQVLQSQKHTHSRPKNFEFRSRAHRRRHERSRSGRL